MKKMISVNPAKNFDYIGTVNISTEEDIEHKVNAAHVAFPKWKSIGIQKRIEILKPLYDEIKNRKEEISLLVSREMGMPIKRSIEDVDFTLYYLDDFLKNAQDYLKPEIIEDGKTKNRIIFEPSGVAAVIVPWNYPLGNFIWGVVPNLIAGNAVVFKHSEETPLFGLLMENIMEKLDIPGGVFSEVCGDRRVGEFLTDQNIDLIWFTGSSKTGKHLYEKAGRKFIKCIMELGGSNPAIIFDDADIDEAVNGIIDLRFSNSGQICDAIKRLIVHESVFGDVVDKLKEKAEQMIMGDPIDDKTDIGPLVSENQLETLKRQADDAIKKGAKVITGGKVHPELGKPYYMPTLITDITKNMSVWTEETFGPVLPVISFRTEEEATELANSTEYGLGAKIYTKDPEKAKRMASKIESGNVEINSACHWHPKVPFGGMKSSGIGREHGMHGFRELCRIKVISV